MNSPRNPLDVLEEAIRLYRLDEEFLDGRLFDAAKHNRYKEALAALRERPAVPQDAEVRRAIEVLREAAEGWPTPNEYTDALLVLTARLNAGRE